MASDSDVPVRPRTPPKARRPKRGSGRESLPRIPKGVSQTSDSEAPGVVHLTAEYWPLARTGGLGEAVAGLATQQARSGAQVTVVLPLYGSIKDSGAVLEPAGRAFPVTVGGRTESARLHRWVNDRSGPRVFLVEHPGYFDRPGIYGADGGDFPDNARRFAFFSQATLAALPSIAPAAQVLHAHDWHTALALVYLRTAFADLPFHRALASVLSVHNAGFQGHFPAETMSDLGLPPELYDIRYFEWYGRMNMLKAGLAFSDMAVTVSPTHARELCTPEGGFGLHDMFRTLGPRLVGILNGIDAKIWDPETDEAIPANFSAANLEGKRECRTRLRRAYGLSQRPGSLIVAMSARLVAQKGIDLVLGASLGAMPDAQFVFLGAGEARYHDALTALAAAAPEQVAVEFGFTDALEHQLMAGADALLMPSLYEPCGLTQMRAQRYGTIPVARRVGGLSDSIADDLTGFLFDEYTPGSLEQALGRALDRYRKPEAWRAIVREAMGRDFGWECATGAYFDVYRRALASRTVSG